MESQSPAANQLDAVAIEPSAPEGWKKKFTQKGGIPRRNDVVFVSPTGEEIKSKRQLELYMKSHPGGSSTSEFYWGSVGDTPRRSSRLNVKSKAVESPESEIPKKKQRKSSSKKEVKEKKDDSDNENKTTEEKGANEDSKESLEVVMEAATTDKDDVKDTEHKSNEGEGVKEEALADVDKLKDAEQKSDKVDDAIMEEPENQEMVNRTSDTKEEGSETKSIMPTPEIKENSKEDEKGADAKDSSQLPFPVEAVASDQGAESL